MVDVQHPECSISSIAKVQDHPHACSLVSINTLHHFSEGSCSQCKHHLI